MTIVEALDYEVASSWWASWVSLSSSRELVARYFAWKVKRKYRRYQEHEQWVRTAHFKRKPDSP